MTLRTATRRAFLYPAATAAAAADWWLSGGIAAASVDLVNQAVGAASLAASYVNLADPGTNDLTAGVAPTWGASTGWSFNGSTQYLIGPAGFDHSTTMLIRVANAVGGNTVACGYYSSNGHRIQPNRADTVRYGGTSSFAPGVSAAVLGIAGTSGYRNGVLDGAISFLDDAAAQPYYIGAQQQSGSANSFWAGDVLAFVRYNIVLDSDEMLAVATAMAAL